MIKLSLLLAMDISFACVWKERVMVDKKEENITYQNKIIGVNDELHMKFT